METNQPGFSTLHDSTQPFSMQKNLHNDYHHPPPHRRKKRAIYLDVIPQKHPTIRKSKSTLPETNISPENRPKPNRKGLYSKYPFLEANC